jgi:hypothetical protein
MCSFSAELHLKTNRFYSNETIGDFSGKRADGWASWDDTLISERHFMPGSKELDAWLDSKSTVSELIQLYRDE